MPSAEPGRHEGRASSPRPRRTQVGDGLARLDAVARGAGVELVIAAATRQPAPTGRCRRRDRARRRRHDAARAARLPRHGDPRARGQLRPRRVPQLDRAGGARGRACAASSRASSRWWSSRRSTSRSGGETFVAVNDAVVTSGSLGRMVELEWAIGGQDFGLVPCDGLICSTPSGSTAYNLSNGGPVLMWGLDAMALDVRRPARPPRAPVRRAARQRPRGLEPDRRTSRCAVLVDGHHLARRGAGRAGRRSGSASSARFSARSRTRRSCSRYRQSFARLAGILGQVCASVRARVYHHHDAPPPPDREPRPHPRGGAGARARAERAHAERPAQGRRSSRRRSGSCSASRGTRPRSARPASEAYVEAELEVPEGFFDDGEMASLAELRPEDEPGLVARPPRLRRRSHARVRVGQARSRGRTSRPRPSG